MNRPPPWEAVWQGNGEAQAQIVADGLLSRGISARSWGVRTGAGGPPHAFQVNTWSVFVPLKQAAEARSLLRTLGEEAGVVHGGGQSQSDMHATLRFFVLLLAGCLLFAVYVALREAI